MSVRQGSAYVFVRPAMGWSTMTESARLTASDGAAGDIFGYSVAANAGSVVIGAYQRDVAGKIDQGAAYVFSSQVPPSPVYLPIVVR